MSDIHLTANSQTSKQKPSVAIYCDLQNVYEIQKQANLLLDFANSKGHLIYKKVYYNSQCKNQACVKDKLKSLGFHCVDVPCPLKNSADNQLKSDLIDDISHNLSPDIVILVSGDGDFANLVHTLQKLSKKVIVIAQRGNVKQKLKEIGDEFHFVEELPNLVEDNTQLKTISIQDKIPYDVASEYLIKSIKLLLDQGKAVVMSSVNNLMCKNQEIFPNYKGVSSILKPDGKTFSQFGKFVDALVKDGKIQKQGQKLFLIEVDKLAA